MRRVLATAARSTLPDSVVWLLLDLVDPRARVAWVTRPTRGKVACADKSEMLLNPLDERSPTRPGD